MASKINSRRKSDRARSGKPYDRPKESLLRRVVSAVLPSFVSFWGKSSEEEAVSAATSVETGVEEEVTESVSETVVPKPCKRPRYASDNLEVADISRPRTTTFLSPCTVNDSLNERVGNSASQVASSCELEKKEPQLIVNGDDHSENSEGTASTSGCSSLISSHVDKPNHSFSSIKLSENALESLRIGLAGKGFLKFKKDAAVSTENSFSSTCNRSASQSDLSLWSRNSNLTLRNTSRPQSAFQSSRPSFSLTSFGGPSSANTSLPAREKLSSPFYEGKTTYGGASAYRRAQLSSLPYQSSRALRSKITVKPSHSSEDSECLSSAAKRILQTLEKMSTPLTDVKKIPNMKKSPVDISASFTPASQRCSYLSLAHRIPLSTPYSKGPPISSVTSASRLNLLKNFSRVPKNSTMEIPVHRPTLMSLDQATQSPLPDTDASKGGGGGGKIRSRMNQHLHQSSKTNDVKEMPEEVHLPNISLPITDLPNINFSPKDKPKFTVPEETSRSSPPAESLSYTFANPIDRSPPPMSLQSRNSISGSYTFSSPLNVNDTTTASISTKPSVEKEKENKPEEKKETELYAGSVNDFLKSLRDNNQKSGGRNNSGQENKNCFNTYKADKELLEPVDAGFGDKFKPEIGSWECTSCLLRNKPDVEKCVACETRKPGSLDKQQSQVFLGFGDKFKPPAGSWECSSCLVRNKPCDNKCVSCETENPNASKDVNQDLKLGENALSVKKIESELVKDDKTFKSLLTGGTWKCDACLEQNPVSQSKCVACETPRMSTETTDSKASSSFRFGLVAPSSSTPFRFGSLVASPISTTASIAFKFGDTSQTSKQQNSVKFGSTTLPSVSSEMLPAATTGGFKFNSPSPMTSIESGGFKFGVPTSEVSLKSSEGLFKCKTPTSEYDKDLISNSNSTPASSFAFGNLNSDNQNKSSDHSKTITTEMSEVTECKTEVETVAKSNTLANESATVQLPKTSSVFLCGTPTSLTNISKTPCTTAVSSAVVSSGFVFGGNTNSSQSQSATTFQFGNKTEDIKTSSSAKSSAQTTTVFTSAPSSGSISSPSPFMLGSQPNKQFGTAEGAAVNAAVGNNQGMTQKTPVELQSAPQVSSSSTLSFPPISTSSQSNFMFGSTSIPPATSSVSMFKFTPSVTTASSTTNSTPKSSGIFTFGVPSSSENKDPKPGFSFASAASEEKSQAVTQSQFTFNAFKPDSSNPVTTSTTTATSSPFRFGATSAPTPASTGGFVFGAPKSDVSQTASSPFTFGSGVATKPLSNSSFVGFAPDQPVTTASVPSFTFGMTSSNTAPVSGGFSAPSSNPSSLFNFGAKTTQAAPNPLNNSGALANSNPVFGSPANQSVFSNSSTIPSFGKPPEQKQETPGSFSFGSSTSQGPLFRFGNTQDGPQEKRHASAPSPAGGFNFSLAQPNVMNNSMNFNPATPPSFNFIGTLPTGAPFQFNASTNPSSGQSSGGRRIRKAVRRNVRKPD